MYRRIREPFGKAGLIVAVVALVAALVGGAYAATSSGKHHKKSNNAGLNGKQKKQVKSIANSEAKKYANSNPGAPGAQGSQGAVGPKGDAGAAGERGEKGEKGDNGTNGTNGTNGENGKSVEAIAIAPGDTEHCEEQGGAFYEVEGSGEATEVCNGKNGEEGSPWTLGGTLPKGATETGAWSFHANEGETVNVPITFSIPLKGALLESEVHFTGSGGDGPGGPCSGTALVPTAPEGELCVYKWEVSGASFGTEGGIYQLTWLTQGASRPGALIYFETVSNGAYGFGSYAVTGS